MEITRRDFLRYLGASAAAMGLSQLDILNADRALAASTKPPVLWLAGSACTGCSVSLLNAVNPTIDQVLLNTISMKFHPQLSAAAGDLAVATIKSTAQTGGHILMVEGAIPTAASGKYCYVWDEGGRSVTMAEAVKTAAAKAKYVIAVGTCAAYGGVGGANPALGSKPLGAFLGKPVINLPGCPSHPDWILGTVVKVLGGSMPTLDSKGRPTVYYTSRSIHDRCPRKGTEPATNFSQDGRCLKGLGCDGPRTHADCDIRKWNNGAGYCIGVNGPCFGCTEPSFPEFPLHKN